MQIKYKEFIDAVGNHHFHMLDVLRKQTSDGHYVDAHLAEWQPQSAKVAHEGFEPSDEYAFSPWQSMRIDK